MNNGLNGRYLEQLEAWNTARQFAAELLTAFYENGISGVLSRWQDSVSYPSKSEIKTMLNDVLFLDGHDTINQLARSVMKWDGWYENSVPSSGEKQKVKA